MAIKPLSARCQARLASCVGGADRVDAAGWLVPVNEAVGYRIPVVGTGYRFAVGHRLRLVLTSDGQDPDFPAMMTFRHASVGASSLNRVAATSRLLLPVAVGKL
jgi:predicted acyl esterase